MAGPLYYDRVMETSTTTGTGTYTLAGAVTGYQTFAVVGNTNTCQYAVWEVDSSGNASGAWEVNVGVYTSAGTTLSRATLLSSSTGAAISWAAGTRRVALALPAELFASAPNYAGGRLTVTTATPVTSADATAQTTLYYTPFISNLISLWNGSSWKNVSFGEVSVAVPSTVCTLFDVFGYLSSGALAIECLNWNAATGPLTSSTNATPIVVTDTAHGLATADTIVIAGHTTNTNANNPYRVTNVTADTFSLDFSIGNGIGGADGNWYKLNNTRATALAMTDGRYTKTGDKTRLYLGTGMTWTTSGQTEDSLQRRLIWNMYNQVAQRQFATTAISTTDAVTTARYRYLTGVTPYTIFVNGLQQTVDFSASFSLSGTATETSRCQVSPNGLTADPTAVYDIVIAAASARIIAYGTAQYTAGCNFNCATMHRLSGANNVTYNTARHVGLLNC